MESELAQSPSVAVTEALRSLLLTSGNGDGGWGYHPGKSSRLEPTCWAALALGGRAARNDAEMVVTLFSRWQRKDGLLADPGIPPNLAFNGLAGLVLSRLLKPPQAVAGTLIEGIHRVKGIKAADRGVQRQDNRLQAWPWMEGVFSWVEPTAWCLLALKRRRRLTGEGEFDFRISEGEAVLFDRACRGGGWNYGNSNVLGQELHPYIPTTALALLALQDRPGHGAVRGGLDSLQANWRTESSGMALALATICLRVYGLPTEELESALAEAWHRTGFLGNLAIMGMACYALGEASHGNSAFRL